eukprot:CAMPEP_0114245486 /NCGR_PEP_ID=MMETSP0058-20121206/11924_1 /TAXON_ID=36894 /ORGANISM="Pyramimonas parkeae, CCMP726" /LENGTH=206 /DNA_ID=CAMNT_0001358547 /DNA_START=199 /DNA_END=819 /DNA_ORIENTATION=+
MRVRPPTSEGEKHVSKRNRRTGEAVTFDPDAHKEWITGFSKRKKERRKAAEKGLADKAQRQKLADRRKRREEIKAKYKEIVGSESDEEENPAQAPSAVLLDHLRPYEGVIEYVDSTQVVVQAIGTEGPGDDDEANQDNGMLATNKPQRSSVQKAASSKKKVNLLGVKKAGGKSGGKGGYMHTKGSGGKVKKKNLKSNTQKKHKGRG